jgi:hypothetical protein
MYDRAEAEEKGQKAKEEGKAVTLGELRQDVAMYIIPFGLGSNRDQVKGLERVRRLHRRILNEGR